MGGLNGKAFKSHFRLLLKIVPDNKPVAPGFEFKRTLEDLVFAIGCENKPLLLERIHVSFQECFVSLVTQDGNTERAITRDFDTYCAIGFADNFPIPLLGRLEGFLLV